MPPRALIGPAVTLLATIDACVEKAIEGQPYYTWPRETWILARLAGRDPDAAARAFHRADVLIGGTLSGMIAETSRA